MSYKNILERVLDNNQNNEQRNHIIAFSIFDLRLTFTAQKLKFSIKDFFSKCDQFSRKLRTRPHLLKKSLMENFIFCAVFDF